MGARGDQALALDDRRRHDAPADRGRRLDRPEAVTEVLAHRGLHVALDDVERALQIALRGADVQPVGVGREAVEAVADELRPDLALDGDVLVGWHEVEDRALEDVGARGDQVGVDLVGRGLLDELAHGAVLFDTDEAVGAGVLDRDERQRRRGLGALVLGDLRGQVDVGEHVAVEHEEALLEQRLGELQRAGGAARVGLLDVAQAQPVRRAVAEDVAHGRGQVAHRHHHVVDAVDLQPLEHVGQERPVDQRDDRFGDRGRQRPEPGPLAADEDHRLHSWASVTPAARPGSGARSPRSPARRRGSRRGPGRCGRRR